MFILYRKMNMACFNLYRNLKSPLRTAAGAGAARSSPSSAPYFAASG